MVLYVNVEENKIQGDLAVHGWFNPKELYKWIRDAELMDGSWVIRLTADYEIESIFTDTKESLSLEDIHKASCKVCDINPDIEKLNKTRLAKFVTQRHLYFAVAKALTKHSYKEIAGLYGQDHVTAVHGKKKISYDIDTNYAPTLFLLADMEKELQCEIIKNIKC